MRGRARIVGTASCLPRGGAGILDTVSTVATREAPGRERPRQCHTEFRTELGAGGIVASRCWTSSLRAVGRKSAMLGVWARRSVRGPAVAAAVAPRRCIASGTRAAMVRHTAPCCHGHGYDSAGTYAAHSLEATQQRL